MYREIRGLPAGHTQWIDAKGAREPKRFASLAEVLATGAKCSRPAGELREGLRSAVLDSVRAHLLADVEVGVFLSAGIDSGALLGAMRDAGQREIRAITLRYEEFLGTSEDEVPMAARVCELFGAKHIVRQVNEQEFHRDLPAILEAMDQPSIDGVNAWFVSKAAREAGLKVALSGLGGDELLGAIPVWWICPAGTGGSVRSVSSPAYLVAREPWWKRSPLVFRRDSLRRSACSSIRGAGLARIWFDVACSCPMN